MKPRVWVVPYLRNWSYDCTAQAIRKHLSNRFEIRIAYQDQLNDGLLESWPADCILDMWWNGKLHFQFGRRVLKQISSHRWRLPKYGGLKASNMLERRAVGLGGIVVPSKRLLHELSSVESGHLRDIRVAPKGFDPDLFWDYGIRAGNLSVGWAGASEAKDKHLADILGAAPNTRLADGQGCLTYREMPAFYNSVDVIAIASSAEGDPRPLIEGMACGCFPVTTDVGIAPELVLHGVNGLIIPTAHRGPDMFRAAFAWCRDNIAQVRAAGASNAIRMRQSRTWAHVMPAWGDAIDAVIARNVKPEPIREIPTQPTPVEPRRVFPVNDSLALQRRRCRGVV